MKEILENAKESLETAEDSLLKNRYNSAIFNFFKTITSFSDYLIYKEIKTLPKNHNERFNLLEKYFPKIHKEIIELFKKYRESYNLRLKKEDALKLREFTYELKNLISNKE